MEASAEMKELFAQAVVLYREGRLAEAAALFRKVLIALVVCRSDKEINPAVLGVSRHVV